MTRLAIVLASTAALLSFNSTGYASDHLFTAVGAGGLTTSSNPFVKANGRPATIVPGQGSPLSGADHTTPAVEIGNMLTHHFTQPNTNANPGDGTLKTPPPVTEGKTAPSANSPHTAVFIP